MKKSISIIIILTAITFGLTAQNNHIVCGQVDAEFDTFNDIQPDTIVHPMFIGSGASEVYLLDLDGNQVFDFRVAATVSISSGSDCYYILVHSLNASNKIAYFIKHDSVPDIFSQEIPMPWIPVDYTVANYFLEDDTINNLNDFIYGGSTEDVVFLAYNTGSPFYEIIDDWLNVGEKYIGISMQVNDITLFGWILVEVTDYTNITIKEFACNKNPYVGIETNKNIAEFELYPNPAKEELFLKLNGENTGKSSTFALFDISGKKVFQVQNVAQNGCISLPKLAKGLYIAGIIIDGQSFSKKLIIE
jgi:hypothetical protein